MTEIVKAFVRLSALDGGWKPWERRGIRQTDLSEATDTAWILPFRAQVGGGLVMVPDVESGAK